jgi:NAD(P)-dependent dehydrogenase (short-subunit alcohol dehydrogenase family)
MSDRVWLITGASRGLGRQWAIAALERGERVAATTRNLVSLADLHQTYGEAVYPIRLDVTDRAACFAAVHAVRERFGRLDVVVNNAGYGQYGFVEELSEAEARNQAARSAILAIVDADDPPLRVFLGKYAFDWARADYAQRLAEWERWQPVAVAAHGGSGQAATIEGMVPRAASEASPEK